MESESKLRRLHFVQGYTIKALVRKTGLSRNTTRRVLRFEKAGRTYERVVFMTDTTPQPRMSAKCFADRHVTYSPNPGSRVFYRIVIVTAH